MRNRIFHLAITFLLGTFLFPTVLYCQTTNISGPINFYTPVLAYGPCQNFVTVTSSANFNVGDTVLIIQMQGATIDQTNTATYGTVTAYNGAGLFEKAQIQSIAGNSIYFVHDLVNTYDFGGKVQMVSVPVYQNANVNGSLTGQAWDGNTGGVVVLDVRGTLSILGGEINMNQKGFRGGVNTETCPNSCNFSQNNTDYFYNTPNYRGSLRGEGIAAVIAGKERGRGAQANGGGGGNDHNAGGGGGSNLSTGGIGSRNNEPGAFNCKGYNPGEPGRALSPAAGARVFMGGGGGSGHGNNGATGGCPANGGSTSGTAGGGIIIVMANTLNASGDAFRTSSTFAGMSAGDGSGGGGAGGTVFLDVNTITATPFNIHATGGNGGPTSCFVQNRCYGPGGGGSGGAVYCKSGSLPAGVTTLINGGTPGIITSSTNPCNNTSGTATAGTAGVIVTNAPSVPMGTTVAVLPCILPVEYAYFTARPGVQNTVRLDWKTTSELNNQRFVIEHSLDAIHFEAVGSVAATMNATEGAEYGFNHRDPVVGDNWYRIRQYDRDGRNSATEIKQVWFEPTAVSIQNLYPNPVSTPAEAILEVMVPGETTGNLSMLNLMGQQVYHMPVDLTGGVNALRIPTQHLGTGIYFLRLNAGRHGDVVTKLKVN